MFTIEPEFLQTPRYTWSYRSLNSETVLMVGWKVTDSETMSFKLTPFIMKFTASSRPPAELNAKDPCPRKGAVRNRSEEESPYWHEQSQIHKVGGRLAVSPELRFYQ